MLIVILNQNNVLFADTKEKHSMRYTDFRCLTQVTNWVRLKFAVIKLKKISIHRWKSPSLFVHIYFFVHFLLNILIYNEFPISVAESEVFDRLSYLKKF